MLGPISSLFALQQARSAVILGVTQTTERLRSRSAMRPEAARDQLLLVVAQTQSPRPIVGQSQTPEELAPAAGGEVRLRSKSHGRVVRETHDHRSCT